MYFKAVNKRKKTILLIAGCITGIAAVVFLWSFIENNKYRSRIPELPESEHLSGPVREQIEDALFRARQKPTADYLGALGMVYHSSANYPEAAQCYQLAEERDPGSWKWNYFNGYLNLEMGEPAAAIENFKSVVEKKPDANLAWYYLGGAYKNQGKNELAEGAFEQLLSKNVPVKGSTRQDHFELSTYARFELARLYFDSGQTDKAEKTLKELIGQQYVFGPAYRLLGTIYNMKGEAGLGEKYTIRASDLVDFTPPVDTLIDELALLSRSELYLLKKIGEAEKSIHSDWTLRLVEHGLKYMPENKYLVSKAIKIYLWKKLDEQAIALINQHIRLFKNDFNEMRNTGLWFFQKERYLQAEEYWTLALKLRPDETAVQQYLAKCYQAAGEKIKALETLDDLINRNPDDANLIADVTYMLLQFREKEKALTYLNRLNRIAPSHPKVQKIRGELAREDGNYTAAIGFFKSSFTGDPDDLQTIKSYGDLLLQEKMWAKYLELCKEALEYHPNNPELLSRLGEVLIDCPDKSVKNVGEGKEYVERAFTYYDCPPDILVSAGSHLAYAYALLGNKQRAITIISQTINIGRKQSIPAEQQNKLENLYHGIQNLN